MVTFLYGMAWLWGFGGSCDIYTDIVLWSHLFYDIFSQRNQLRMPKIPENAMLFVSY